MLPKIEWAFGTKHKIYHFRDSNFVQPDQKQQSVRLEMTGIN